MVAVTPYRKRGRLADLDGRIRELHGAGWNDRRIACHLDLSWSGVRYRRVKMGLPANADRPWTVIEERRAVALAESGKTHAAIAVMLGRTESAIDNRLCRVGGGELDFRRDRASVRRSLAWEMFGRGRTAKDVANHLGVLVRTARRYRQEMPAMWSRKCG